MSRVRLPITIGIASRFSTSAVRWVAMLLLCSAYIQGGLTKLFDFNAAIAEMNHFGLAPAVPFAVLVIALELIASLMILCGIYRWVAALGLAGFTAMATFLANRFWEALPPDRLMMMNSFFEHLGLVGGFFLVAWHDLRAKDDIGKGARP